MNYLDREGIFKAQPIAWRVKRFDGKLSVAISIDFVVTAQLEDYIDDDGKPAREWKDWSGYEEHQVSGDFWVVKKDGQPNVKTIQTLADVLGWRGQLSDVLNKRAPEVVVQVTVKSETYEGKTFYKVQWLNPEDWTPTPQGASEDEVKQLDARFGSLLRAAAGSGAKAPPPKAAPAKPQPKPAPKQDEPEPTDTTDYSSLPF